MSNSSCNWQTYLFPKLIIATHTILIILTWCIMQYTPILYHFTELLMIPKIPKLVLLASRHISSKGWWCDVYVLVVETIFLLSKHYYIKCIRIKEIFVLYRAVDSLTVSWLLPWLSYSHLWCATSILQHSYSYKDKRQCDGKPPPL